MAESLHHVATWYDSPDRHDRRRSLQLWSDGTLYVSSRLEPGDVWSPAELIGREADEAAAARIAAQLDLGHREGAEPHEAA